MATSSQVRKWWAGYYRRTDRMVRVAFPGVDGKIWRLLVADKSAPVWQAVTQIMTSEPYLFRESAGGTYHPREDGSTSLHPYGLAIDLNPSKNPHKNPLTTDMPASFIERMEGIKANGKKAITWGGRWTTAPSKPDAMHYQINVAPEDCDVITWDRGDQEIPDQGEGDEDVPLTDAEIEKIAKRAAELVWAQQMSVPEGGTKAAAWVVGQGYVLDTRSVKASEAAAADTEIIKQKLDA